MVESDNGKMILAKLDYKFSKIRKSPFVLSHWRGDCLPYYQWLIAVKVGEISIATPKHQR
jgi:hypothetical protein